MADSLTKMYITVKLVQGSINGKLLLNVTFQIMQTMLTPRWMIASFRGVVPAASQGCHIGYWCLNEVLPSPMTDDDGGGTVGRDSDELLSSLNGF